MKSKLIVVVFLIIAILVAGCSSSPEESPIVPSGSEPTVTVEEAVVPKETATRATVVDTPPVVPTSTDASELSKETSPTSTASGDDFVVSKSSERIFLTGTAGDDWVLPELTETQLTSTKKLFTSIQRVLVTPAFWKTTYASKQVSTLAVRNKLEAEQSLFFVDVRYISAKDFNGASLSDDPMFAASWIQANGVRNFTLKNYEEQYLPIGIAVDHVSTGFRPPLGTYLFRVIVSATEGQLIDVTEYGSFDISVQVQ